jgi:hypothetical protein
MSLYKIEKDMLETNKDGDVVGASKGLLYLVGLTIEEVIKDCNERRKGIKRVSHQDTRLPHLQEGKRAFRTWGRRSR